ncbi:MAG TPA: ABC transporter substrate-binding protein [Xanthobacteraceae bacterium]|nr:ABC transporter substrate-binding protein [Xanthobacteraceae bacterium]
MNSGIRRRAFLSGLGGAAVAWPLAVHAQQSDKAVPIIGVLGVDETGWGPWAAAFVARLRERGWIEGRTVAVEYRWDEGRNVRDAEIAAEFIRQKVDVILANGKGAVALKQATAAIPIVFPLAPDPVGGGLVASLARPGGNVTGLSIQATDLASKRLELLREVAPGLRRLAIMFDAGYSQAALEVGEVQTIAHTLGFDVMPLEIRRAADIAPAFDTLKGKADALYVVLNALINANQARIIALAIGARLPTIFGAREYVHAGAFMSYGPNFPDLFRRAADIVDKILRGAKPADIPVEPPTKFELVFNLKTAKAIGLTIPPNLLAIADEVIE